MRSACVAALLAASGAAGGRWTARALAGYARARAGRGDEPLVWHGRGTLQNAVTGRHIADVESLERATRLAPAAGDAPGCRYRSERVLVYRYENGTRLRRFSQGQAPPRFGGRAVPPPVVEAVAPPNGGSSVGCLGKPCAGWNAEPGRPNIPLLGDDCADWTAPAPLRLLRTSAASTAPSAPALAPTPGSTPSLAQSVWRSSRGWAS